MFAFFFQRSIDALVRATKSSLEALRRRAFAFTVVTEEESNFIRPFLYTSMILHIPNISISPSLDEIQLYCGKVVSNILEIHKGVIQWGQRSSKLKALAQEPVPVEGTTLHHLFMYFSFTYLHHLFYKKIFIYIQLKLKLKCLYVSVFHTIIISLY